MVRKASKLFNKSGRVLHTIIEQLEPDSFGYDLGLVQLDSFQIPELNDVTNVIPFENCRVKHLELSDGHFSDEYDTENKDFLILKDASSGSEENLKNTLKSFPERANLKDERNGETALIAAAKNGHLRCVKLLFEHGAKLDETMKDGKTAVHGAVLQNHFEVVQWMTSNGVDVNVQDNSGLSPLMLGSFVGNVEIVKHLLSNGSKVNEQDNNGRTALMLASQEGHTKVSEFLLANDADTMVADTDGNTALSYCMLKENKELISILVKADRKLLGAQGQDGVGIITLCALNNKIDMITCLVELGASLEEEDDLGRTPLMAGLQNVHIETVKYLIGKEASLAKRTKTGKGALDFALLNPDHEYLTYLLQVVKDINIADINEDTPFMNVVNTGNETLTQLLVDSEKVDINFQNKHGRTALMIASMNGFAEIVDILLQAKADANIKSKNGLTALLMAKCSDHMNVVEKLLRAGASKDVLPDRTNLHSVLVAANRMGKTTIWKEIISKDRVLLNMQDKCGLSPLMIAAHYGNTKSISYLIELGAIVDLRNHEGISALVYAVNGLHLKAIDLLLGYGADINIENGKGKSLVHSCVENDNEEGLRVLVGLGADINKTDNKGMTPLMIAAEKGNLPCLMYLLQMYADIQKTSNEQLTALNYAFTNNHDVAVTVLDCEEKTRSIAQKNELGKMLNHECLQGNIRAVVSLLEADFPVNFHDDSNSGSTALIQSCFGGHLNVGKLLVQKGANVNIPDYNGHTSLIIAANFGHLKIVKWLIENEANINAVSKSGTALAIASQEGHLEVVSYLLEKFALMNIKQKQTGHTALTFAAFKNHLLVAQALLENGALVNVVDEQGRPPLIAAIVEANSVEMVQLLIKHGADPNFKDSLDRTPLMAAAQEGLVDIAKCLLQHGALLNAKNSNGWSAAEYAVNKEHFEFVQWLIDEGAPSQDTSLVQDHSARTTETQGFLIGDTIPNNPANSKILTDGLEKTQMSESMSKQSHEMIQEAKKQLFDMCHEGWGFDAAVHFFVSKGIDLNAQNEDGQTALIIATQNRYTGHVEWLLKYGADVDCVDSEGNTPLLYAVKNSDFEMVKVLVEHSADKTIKNHSGKDACGYAMELDLSDIEKYLKEDHSQVDKMKFTALMKAVCSGKVHNVKTELQKKEVNVNARDDEGKTALAYCTEEKWQENLEIASILLENGAEIDAVDDSGNTALFLSWLKGNLEMANFLLVTGACPTHCNDEGQTIIYEAVLKGDWQFVSMALKAALTLSHNDDSVFQGAIQLAVASCQSQFFACLELAKISPETFPGIPMLFYCVYFNNETMAEEVLKYTVDINEKNEEGQTCLMVACDLGYVNMVKYLLSKEINTQLKDTNEKDAFQLALEHGHYEVADVLMSCQTVQEAYGDFILVDATNNITEKQVSQSQKLEKDNKPEFTRQLQQQRQKGIKGFPYSASDSESENQDSFDSSLQSDTDESENDGKDKKSQGHIEIGPTTSGKIVDEVSDDDDSSEEDDSVDNDDDDVKQPLTLGRMDDKVSDESSEDDDTDNDDVQQLIQRSREIEELAKRDSETKVLQNEKIDKMEENIRQLQTKIDEKDGIISKMAEDLKTLEGRLHDKDKFQVKMAECMTNMETWQAKMDEKVKKIDNLQGQVHILQEWIKRQNETNEQIEELLMDDLSDDLEGMRDLDAFDKDEFDEHQEHLHPKIDEVPELKMEDDLSFHEESQAGANDKFGNSGGNSTYVDKKKAPKIRSSSEYQPNLLILFNHGLRSEEGKRDTKSSNTQLLADHKSKKYSPEELLKMIQKVHGSDKPCLTCSTCTFVRKQATRNFDLEENATGSSKSYKYNYRNVEMMYPTGSPNPKLYIYKLHSSISQNTIDGNNVASTACAIISLLFAHSFIQDPTELTPRTQMYDLPDKVFDQVENALREGNAIHSLNYKGQPVNLGPEEVRLLATHLNVKFVMETDVDTRDPETFKHYLMDLKEKQALLLIKNYRVISIMPCNNGEWLLLFDSHPHAIRDGSGILRYYGAYFLLAKREEQCMENFLSWYDYYCDPVPFYGKFVLFDV